MFLWKSEASALGTLCQIRLPKVRFTAMSYIPIDDGHWKTNRIRRLRPLLQSIFANFGDVEDVWAALLSS